MLFICCSDRLNRIFEAKYKILIRGGGAFTNLWSAGVSTLGLARSKNPPLTFKYNIENDIIS